MPKSFIPQKELRANPCWGPLEGLFNLCVIGEQKNWGLKITIFDRLFSKDREPLLPGWVPIASDTPSFIASPYCALMRSHYITNSAIPNATYSAT